jgi:hypothetical protein
MTEALSVARLTDACTSATALSRFSTLAAQAAQVIPVTSSSNRRDAADITVSVRSADVLRAIFGKITC